MNDQHDEEGPYPIRMNETGPHLKIELSGEAGVVELKHQTATLRHSDKSLEKQTEKDFTPERRPDLEYLDFELRIGPGSGSEYPIAASCSLAGEARETTHFPIEDQELEKHLRDLQNALLRASEKGRVGLSSEEQSVQDLGRSLFDALVTGEVRSRYDVSKEIAIREGKGLRLKLYIRPPELATLPWEFLYDPRQGDYVCLSLQILIVRYLELAQSIKPLAVKPPLRILGMAANPQDLPPLDVGQEKRRVEQAIQDLRAKGLVTLTWLQGQTWRHLSQAMQSGPWHIFHFIGHGGFDRDAGQGFIALADEEGKSHHMTSIKLGRLLADHRSLRLVLLNACEGALGNERDVFSSTATTLARRGIPAVLAMQYKITDRGAIELTRSFYEALARSMPVDAAVAEARKAISIAVENSVEWGAPVLYMRASDGILFSPYVQMVNADKVLTRSRTRPVKPLLPDSFKEALQTPPPPDE
jgi:CHAT domain-containing protein